MAPDPFNTALSATLMATSIFPFLELPVLVRRYIYEYALTTEHGLWIDADRRQLPPFWLKNNVLPSVGDIQAATSSLPIISPALLRVCKQIHREAHFLLRRNTWNFIHFSNYVLRSIPQPLKDSIRSVYFRAGALTEPKGPGMCAYVTSQLRGVRTLTLGLRDDDEGLKGATEQPLTRPEAELKGENAVLYIIRFHVWELFREGRMTTFRLECPSTYPSELYPFVWVWAWVQRTYRSLLPVRLHRTLDPLYAAVLEVLQWRETTSLLDYQRLLAKKVYVATGEELPRAVARIAQVWQENGVHVSARDPEGFERGTVITFQKVDAVEADGQESWGDNELAPKVRRGRTSPNFPRPAFDLSKIPKEIDGIKIVIKM